MLCDNWQQQSGSIKTAQRCHPRQERDTSGLPSVIFSFLLGGRCARVHWRWALFTGPAALPPALWPEKRPCSVDWDHSIQRQTSLSGKQKQASLDQQLWRESSSLVYVA